MRATHCATKAALARALTKLMNPAVLGLAGLAGLLVVSGCAKKPEAIAPAYVSHMQY